LGGRHCHEEKEGPDGPRKGALIPSKDGGKREIICRRGGKPQRERKTSDLLEGFDVSADGHKEKSNHFKKGAQAS